MWPRRLWVCLYRQNPICPSDAALLYGRFPSCETIVWTSLAKWWLDDRRRRCKSIKAGRAARVRAEQRFSHQPELGPKKKKEPGTRPDKGRAGVRGSLPAIINGYTAALSPHLKREYDVHCHTNAQRPEPLPTVVSRGGGASVS